jgi:hypothetical protein
MSRNQLSRIPLEKLIAAQLVKKFPDFMNPKASLQRSQQPASEAYSKLG